MHIKTSPLSERLVGSRIEVRPFGGQAFFCEVCGMNMGKELSLRYSGIYTGTGTWTITEANGRCQVTYQIRLEIQSSLVRLVSSVLPVDTIHSKLMEKVLAGLGQYLGNGEKRTGEAS